MTSVRSFTKDRWCFHIGPVQVIWMRRPMVDKMETLIQISWLSRHVGQQQPQENAGS